MLTLPVNWWVLVIILPKCVDPVTKLTLDVIICAIIVWAVSVPLTKKSSADDAVVAYEALIAFRTYDAVVAYDAVPNNDPVKY